jgi:hypothetical protein
MVSESWQPFSANFSLSPACGSLNISAGDVSAAVSADGKTASVRVVNAAAEALQVAVTMDHGTDGTADERAEASVLEGSSCARSPGFPYVSEHTRCANTPAEPLLFSPTPWAVVGSGDAHDVPGYSYAVFKLSTA